MSTLILVRHGQARAYEPDSDRLSELGARQADALGRWCVEQGVEVDAVCSGTLERQRQTAAIVGEVVRGAGRTWPDAVEDPGWNEYDADGVLSRLMPRLVEVEPPFAERVRAFQEAFGGSERNRYFQRMFEELMVAWAAERVVDPAVEPFNRFRARVTDAFGRIRSGGGSRTVMVFTSGGPIGVCVQTAVRAPAPVALELNWRVKNASLTEIVFSKDRMSLDRFNTLPHLPSELQSFR